MLLLFYTLILNVSKGVNLGQVSLHEIGHSLGLDHSEKPESIMSPVYQYKKEMKLTEDDIFGIHSIYDQ